MSDYPRSVKVWLCIGLFMVFMQIIIGGITRLTGSGLSITKWEIVTGTFPPLTQDAWNAEFDLYKETPQYEKINRNMSLSKFKFIYFWEYFHRVWARSMGFVFLFPFLYFWRKGYLDNSLKNRLAITVGLAAVVAVFGWIMVASGLVNRPWVNAYKLTWHLSLALILYGYLLYVTYKVINRKPRVTDSAIAKPILWILTILIVQIMLGGMMSGMRAALSYPTWPDMYGAFIPDVLLQASNWNISNFVMYDSNTFMPALIQFLHRGVAYILFIAIALFSFIQLKRSLPAHLRNGTIFMLLVCILQMILGIITVILSKGMIPVLWGVLHQGVAIILLSSVLYLIFSVKKS